MYHEVNKTEDADEQFALIALSEVKSILTSGFVVFRGADLERATQFRGYDGYDVDFIKLTALHEKLTLEQTSSRVIQSRPAVSSYTVLP